jgi:PAS domain S-box-containing protein
MGDDGALVDALPFAVASLDGDLRHRFTNQAYAKWMGRAHGALAGTTLAETLGPMAFERLRPAIVAAGEGRPADLELTLGGPDVPTFAVTVQRHGDGFLICARAVAGKATATHEAESDTRFQTMADSAPVLLWMAGTNGLCTFFNQRWLDFTGRPMEAEVGNGWAEGVHPEDFQNCMDVYLSAFVAQRPFQMEYRLRRRDGAYRFVLDIGRPLYGSAGEFTGYIGSCIDVTDRRQAEDERTRLFAAMRSARDDAERANRCKDEFLATLSHELRTPLNAIVGWGLLLRDADLNKEEAARAVEAIVRNGQVQAHLISDILDVSRITSGQMRLEIAPCRLAHPIGAAAEAVRPAALAKELRLLVHVDELPALVHMDGRRLQQAVWNLLSNAAKFTPHGGTIRVDAGLRGPEIEIAVSDDGPGIPEDFLPHVFERFRQADSSTTRSFGGLGLGLAIARHIVELHGGTVTAANRPEGGALFQLRIPLRLAEERRAARDERSEHRMIPGRSLAGVRVLVVDDDLESREVAAKTLRQFGATVSLAVSAAEALDHLARDAPHVLVADIGMPGEDGNSLMRRIRALSPENGGQIPALALTGHAGLQDRMRALDSGFEAHLSKPVSPRLLLAAVRRLQARSRARLPQPDQP